MNKYIAFFNGKQIEVDAAHSFEAQKKAIEIFKPAKSKRHMVHAHLAAIDGREVVHVAVN